MGQVVSSIIRCISLCGESYEDHPQNQYETLPLLTYPQIPSPCPSCQSALNDIKDNHNASLLRTLSSSSSSSNLYIDSTKSHISLPPYTPPGFNNNHSIKCDALDDDQSLRDLHCHDLSPVIIVKSSSEYSASFSGTSSSHGDDLEGEFFYFPRFGSLTEYPSMTTESNLPIDPVIEEEEDDLEGEFVYFPRFGSLTEYPSVTTESDLPIDPVIEEEKDDLEGEFVYFSRFGSLTEYPSVTTESDLPTDPVIEEEEESGDKRDQMENNNNNNNNNNNRRRRRRSSSRRRRRRRRVVIKEIRWINHYSSEQRILLVGEGDFSFSASLALAFGSAYNIVATSLNSEEYLRKNYMKAMSNIQTLRDRGSMVLHRVDAMKMANYLSLKGIEFDRIIYNFPLAGFFPDEPRNSEIRRHRALVGGFLENAKKMISENGEIHITHKSCGFFREWKLEALALVRGLQLIQELHFNFKDYPGYHTKYGFGGDKNFNCNPSKTYKFGLLQSFSNSLY